MEAATIMMVHERTLEQRMSALAGANKIRTKRARLKRDIKAGKILPQALLVNPPEWMRTMYLADLLMAVPKYGRIKVNRILLHYRISQSKTIGGLSERQRAEIVKHLRRQ